ncbi:MAG: RNA methyltransferase, partial [Candidatus Aminicenantes bacterium]|nr:RNA methyltransferase [Candidatus Aminicenantes bacterium]
VQALLPAKKMEFLLQKSAELGCAGFVPVTTERSLKDPPERSGRKLERWARIAREATKQSKGGRSTAVRAPVTLKTLLREAPEGRKLFLSERGGRPLKDVLSAQGPGEGAAPLSVSLVVGPEGGWTLNEESLLREAGFEAVGLGHRILKAETAALAASAMILHYWNE